MSHSEIEVKLPVSDLSQITSTIEAQGASISRKRHFEDNFIFDDAAQSLRNSGRLLRVRMLDKSATLTLKNPAVVIEGVKKREEIECALSEPEHLIRIISELGYGITFRYQKYRTVYGWKEVDLEVCVDETPIGNFLELEGEISAIHETASRLGFDRSQYISESYAALYFQWCGERDLAPAFMMFDTL